MSGTGALSGRLRLRLRGRPFSRDRASVPFLDAFIVGMAVFLVGSALRPDWTCAVLLPATAAAAVTIWWSSGPTPTQVQLLPGELRVGAFRVATSDWLGVEIETRRELDDGERHFLVVKTMVAATSFWLAEEQDLEVARALAARLRAARAQLDDRGTPADVPEAVHRVRRTADMEG